MNTRLLEWNPFGDFRQGSEVIMEKSLDKRRPVMLRRRT